MPHRRTPKTLIAVTALLSLVAVLTVPPLVGTAFGDHTVPASQIVGGFEIDGNLNEVTDSDWDTTDLEGYFTEPDAVGILDDGFVPGVNAQEGAWPLWSFNSAAPPPSNKDDLTRVHFAAQPSPASTYLYLAFERLSGVGDAHVTWEFNQDEWDAGENPDRSVGDFKVEYAYSGAADVVTITAYAWDGLTWDACGVTCDTIGDINNGTITNLQGDSLPARTFGEAGVDLLPLLAANSVSCANFTTMSARTRESHNAMSQLTDLSGPWDLEVDTCGSITVTKEDATSNALLDGATFELFEDNGTVGTYEAGTDVSKGTCTTDATGTCTFSDLEPGPYLVVETAAPAGYGLDPTSVQAVTVVAVTDTPVLFSDPRIPYRVSLSADATNLVGSDHVFTVTVESDADLDSVYTDIADGTTVALGWLGPVGSSITSEDCTTTGTVSGDCTVTVSSSATGTGTLTATYTTPYQATTAVTTGDTADKTWVDYDLAVDADSINEVGEPHTFTVTVTEDTGAGFVPLAGVTPTITWTGTTITSDTCTSPGTAADGTCTVTVDSDDTGTGMLTAAHSWTLDSGTVDRDDDATKQWIDHRVTVSPDAVNEIGDPHDFTVTIKTDTGTGFGPAAGLIPDISWVGDGAITADTCTSPGTAADGTCTVTVLSNDIGSGTLTASYTDTSTDSGDFTRDDASTKTWVSPPDTHPAIDLEKSASDDSVLCERDGTCPKITYTYDVTNTGDTVLSDLELDDDKLGAITLEDTELAPGESTTATAEYTPTGNDLGTTIVNIALVAGTAPDGSTVDDDAQAEVDIVVRGVGTIPPPPPPGPIPLPDDDPDISVTKSASPVRAVCDPSGDCPTVTYEYVVTNTGEVALNDLSLVDDKLGAVSLSVDSLAPGASTTTVATYTPVAADIGTTVVNIATVEGSSPDDELVSDTDLASVEVVQVLGVVVTPEDPAPLPRTGIDLSWLAVVGFLALAGGAALVVVREQPQRAGARSAR